MTRAGMKACSQLHLHSHTRFPHQLKLPRFPKADSQMSLSLKQFNLGAITNSSSWVPSRRDPWAFIPSQSKNRESEGPQLLLCLSVPSLANWSPVPRRGSSCQPGLNLQLVLQLHSELPALTRSPQDFHGVWEGPFSRCCQNEWSYCCPSIEIELELNYNIYTPCSLTVILPNHFLLHFRKKRKWGLSFKIKNGSSCY